MLGISSKLVEVMYYLLHESNFYLILKKIIYILYIQTKKDGKISFVFSHTYNVYVKNKENAIVKKITD